MRQAREALVDLPGRLLSIQIDRRESVAAAVGRGQREQPLPFDVAPQAHRTERPDTLGREGRLPRPRHAGGGQEQRRSRRRQPLGQIEVAVGLAPGGGRDVRRAIPLRGTDRRDGGADDRPGHAVNGEDGGGRVIIGGLHPGAGHLRGEVGPAPAL